MKWEWKRHFQSLYYYNNNTSPSRWHWRWHPTDWEVVSSLVVKKKKALTCRCPSLRANKTASKQLCSFAIISDDKPNCHCETNLFIIILLALFEIKKKVHWKMDIIRSLREKFKYPVMQVRKHTYVIFWKENFAVRITFPSLTATKNWSDTSHYHCQFLTSYPKLINNKSKIQKSSKLLRN